MKNVREIGIKCGENWVKTLNNKHLDLFLIDADFETKKLEMALPHPVLVFLGHSPTLMPDFAVL